MLDPEFLEWLREGTREEVYAKNRKFIAYLREHPEIYVGKIEWLDEMEASINRSEAANERIKFLKKEAAYVEEEMLNSEAAYDESAPRKQKLLQISLSGKSPKNSH